MMRNIGMKKMGGYFGYFCFAFCLLPFINELKSIPKNAEKSQLPPTGAVSFLVTSYCLLFFVFRTKMQLKTEPKRYSGWRE